jgi:OOP family OmpA-OmpF porin
MNLVTQHIMKKILTGILSLFFLVSHSQFTYDYLKAADTYFKKADYFSAAEYYEKYIALGKTKNKGNQYNPYTIQTTSKKSADKTVLSSKEQALYNLAECYRLLHYPSKAEPVYKAVVELNAFPLATFHYGTILKSLEKFDDAETQFKTFLGNYKNEDAYNKTAQRELKNLEFIKTQMKRKDAKLFTVNKTMDNLATGATYATVYTNNNIYFTSTRADSSASKNNIHNNRIYQSTYSNGNFTNVELVKIPSEANVHQGVITVSKDGNSMYLTQWSTINGAKVSGIYFTKKVGSQWSAPVSLGETVNVNGYNSQQPFLMSDGKTLLFSSNKEGGAGGFDLWSATVDAQGKASNVVNLGNTINTEFDEQAPFYHDASESLLFSTNGRVGMGGFDCFQSKGQLQNLSEPINLGYPVNSVKDDIYLVSKGSKKNVLENVFLSSDRSAACCLELFALSKANVLKQVNGKVIACNDHKPVSGASVSIIDPSNYSIVYTKITGDDGTYSFMQDDFKPLKAVVTFSGYEDASLSFNGSSNDEELTVLSNPDICLTPIPVPEVEEGVLENVEFEFNKYVLLESSYVMLDKVVEKLNKNPKMIIEISGHTDSKGAPELNMKLSEARAKSCVDYILSKGIDSSRVMAKGYGETMPIAKNQNDDGTDNPEGRQKNRRTEFKIISNEK